MGFFSTAHAEKISWKKLEKTRFLVWWFDVRSKIYHKVTSIHFDQKTKNGMNRTKVEFFIEFKNVANTVYFHKKRHFAAPLKEKKIVVSEFVKICHEQVTKTVRCIS